MLLNDFRYAIRTLRRAPVFSAAVILTVALAVGANTAIFSVVNAVIIRPLPFADPGWLVQVVEKNDAMHLPTFGVSAPNYLSWKEQTQTLQLAAIGFGTFSLSGSGEPEQFTGSPITPSLLPIVGLSPIAGRAFTEDEAKPGAPRVVMIGEGLWKRRFGSDPALIGRTLTFNGVDYTVVGVAPAALTVLTNGDIWTPLTIDPGREIRLNHTIFVVGRLRPGASVAQAQADMNTVASHLSQQYPEMKDWGARVITFYNAFVSTQLQTALLVLLAAVAFVLLIACANIANLLLARAAARQKEIAIRTAMGASRGRLLGQLLAESITLSCAGGAIGIVLAVWAVKIINSTLPPNLLPIPEVGVDATVLLYATGVTLATGLLFGLAPSWRSAAADVHDALKQAGRSSGGAARPWLRNGLAAAELALATVLLIGAGLLVQTLFQLQRARLGFEPRGVLTFQLAPPPVRYSADTTAPAFYRSLIESLQTIPGVRAAAVSSGVPFGVGNYTQTPVATAGKSTLPPETEIPIDWRIVSPGYFRAMGIPLLRGRDFTDADNSATRPVTIVSQATARTFWGDDDPIGRTLHRRADTKVFTVVGVVGDVRNTTLNKESPSLYYPSAARVAGLMEVVIRVDGDPHGVLPAVRQKVHELDRQLPLSNVRTMDEWVTNNAAQPRLNAQLLAIFAAVALAIAAIGIYGVLAYSVTQRTHEIGVRIALGAQPRGVVRLIVREGMRVGLLGIGAGLAAALALSRALASLLFGVPERDPLTFVSVAAALTLVALAACALPARRASRVDPLVALRTE
ncbi:MAG TPA: ABC transporter permease [Vicinamibacterales bacterium]|nr:ABC transporter permease [Vicinamibacterales bacterium]